MPGKAGDDVKVLLVSNMYPSAQYPHYGVFVQKTENVLGKIPNMQIRKAVMQKRDGKLRKICAYLRFYSGIVLRGVFGRPDVIYAHFISHAALPLRIVKLLNRKSKLVLNAHGNDVIADTQKDEKWIKQSHKIVPKADCIIVPSEYFKKIMEDRFDVSPDRLTVYPSGGVDTAVFHPQERKPLLRKYNLSEEVRYIGYISRLEADKGWDVFLEAVALLKDRQELGFLVVGDGAEREAFEEQAEKLGVKQRLIRYPLLSQQQIAQLYNVLDVFCFPTRRKSESLGLVGLEAMACGCAVVTTDVCGPASYIRPGQNGYVFEATSAKSLVLQIEKALSASEEEKAQFKIGMRETVQRYSENATASVLTELFCSFQV